VLEREFQHSVLFSMRALARRFAMRAHSCEAEVAVEAEKGAFLHLRFDPLTST
jgi:hypothetical protein